MSDNSATPEYGGYTVVARALSNAHHDWRPEGFRRQQIHVWWVRRGGNGFPDKHRVTVGSREKDLFKVEEVLTWFTGYTPSTGGRRGSHGRETGQKSSS